MKAEIKKAGLAGRPKAWKFASLKSYNIARLHAALCAGLDR